MARNGLHACLALAGVLTLALVLPGQAFAERASVTACGDGGGVAVVNMETVARALGRDATIEQQIGTRTEELRGELEQVAKEIAEKLEAEAAKAPEQRAQLQQQAQAAFHEQQLQAQEVLAQLRTKLATDFRDEVKAVARSVAKERGFSAVFVDEVVLYYEDTRDITSDVTRAMRGSAATDAGDAAPAAASPAGAPPGRG